MMDPLDDSRFEFLVLVNERGEYLLWPEIENVHSPSTVGDSRTLDRDRSSALACRLIDERLTVVVDRMNALAAMRAARNVH
jgi:hypothetical protein